ncbi:serum response factor homolog [Panonychus citri]|uniref:serum response factor homolog n=1 Tax=Panonychus citri TaxID=50023 RepID=UPI00230747EC|nr:serum response factor homolog [Panonychus citri]
MTTNSVDFYLSQENNLLCIPDHGQSQQQQQQHQHQQHQHQQPQPQQQQQQQQQSSTEWTNGSTTLSLVHHQLHHHQQQSSQQSQQQQQQQQHSDTLSPVSNPRQSPTITKRYLTEYISENGSVNDTCSSEPLPKKLHTNGKKTKGRVKIKMEFIDNKLRRYTTFSKRKSGIMKKAYELSTLTGTQVMLLVASETGHVYTFATKKLKPMITSDTGKALIKTCLFSPEPQTNGYDPRMSSTGYEETELSYSVNDDSSEKDEEDSSSSQGIFSSSTGAIGTTSNSSNSNHNNQSSSSLSNLYHQQQQGKQQLTTALALTTTKGNCINSSSSSSSSSSPSPSGLSSISIMPNNCSTKSSNQASNHNLSSTVTLIDSKPATTLPLKLTTSTNTINRSIGLSNNHNDNNTGTTFTAAILGGILPQSTLSNRNSNSQESHESNGSMNSTTVYKIPEFGASSLSDQRLSSKLTSPLFNTGNVVLCTNQTATSNGYMYHTPQGVVYATNPNSLFAESLILKFGQNLSQKNHCRDDFE